MFEYETNLFENGQKTYSKVTTLSDRDLLWHTGKQGRMAFLELVNRWNRQGMIGFANHGKTYVYVAL